MSRIVVIGARGRVAQALTPLLRASGHDVIATSSDPDALRAMRAGNDQCALADPQRQETVRDAVRGAGAVFLATGDAMDQDAKEAAIITAIAGGASDPSSGPFVLKLSAQSAGLDPPVSFGVQHRKAEEALARSGLPHAILRPVFFQQSLLLMAGDIAKGRMVAPTKTGRVAMVDVRDVAAVAAAILDDPKAHDGAILELTGPEALSFAQIADTIAAETEHKVRHISPPGFVARLVLPMATGMPRPIAAQVVALMRAISQGAQSEPTRAVEALTGRPPRPIAAFVKENRKAFTP